MHAKLTVSSKLYLITYSVLLGLISAVITWSIIQKSSVIDPDIEQKYDVAVNDLRKIKRYVTNYYCLNRRFPRSLDELGPEIYELLPKDPWNNDYTVTFLPWRTKGSGVDLISMGGDGKKSGKGMGRDIIIRIDRSLVRCVKVSASII